MRIQFCAELNYHQSVLFNSVYYITVTCLLDVVDVVIVVVVVVVVATSKFRRNSTLLEKQLSDFSETDRRHKQGKVDRTIRLFAI